MISFATALALLTSLIAQPATASVPAPTIKEWQVPWENTRPRDPIVARNGEVWFVGQVGNYVGVLTPDSGKFRRFELPQNTLPHNIILGPQSDLWLAGNGNGTVLRMDPHSGKVKKTYAMPKGVLDPHTMIFGPDSKLWFTAQHSNVIGRLDPERGEVKLIRPSVEQARPYGIISGQDGKLWVVLFATNRLLSVDAKTLKTREYTLPEKDARPRRLAQTRDGAVWYVDYARGELGRLEPRTGQVSTRSIPGGRDAQPYAMAADNKERLWFAESGVEPNRIIGFDPAQNRFSEPAPVPSGGGTVRHMVFDKVSNALWFGTDSNTIGRAALH
jgi:virginiamycin B lyase